MRRPLAWLVAVGILLAAGVVVALEPQEQWAQGPIAVNVALGEEGVGRNIEATIHSVAVAKSLEVGDWRGDTEGVWVVVEVTVANRVSPRGIQSFLLIGDKEFRGSERLDFDGLESWPLAPGLPTTGAIAFEIPRELLAEHAEVRLGLSSDSRLDSVITTTVDLAELAVLPLVVVDPAGRVDP